MEIRKETRIVEMRAVENPDNKIKEFFPHFPQNEFNLEINS
jgi:hypothetical protein